MRLPLFYDCEVKEQEMNDTYVYIVWFTHLTMLNVQIHTCLFCYLHGEVHIGFILNHNAITVLFIS